MKYLQYGQIKTTNRQFVTCPSSKILGYGMSKIGGSLS